jgi:hypothetical protein
MENENSIDWFSFLIQWVAFFCIFGIILLPAFKFKNLAKEYNKKGWPYFIAGLIMGIVGINFGRLILFLVVVYVGLPKEYGMYSVLLICIPAYLFYLVCYKFVKKYFMESKK